ncbi:MAG: hypothetical protein RIS47_158 [Bacteroidota bacterium]
MSFSSLGLHPNLITALQSRNYASPYPIQTAVIPAVIGKRDVLGIAPTGSGKTASYVLPILTNLQGQKLENNRMVNVLVLVPTRELAVQVRDVFQDFSHLLPNEVRCKAVFGGVAINPQMKGLMGINVLVATPGRLLELVDSNAVHLSQVNTLVLDEADKMLNLGFADEMKRIFGKLPAIRQNLLFSATLGAEVEQVRELVLHDPFVAKIEADELQLDLIQQLAFTVSDAKKGPLLRYLIKQDKWQQVLVFASSVYKADLIADKLRKHGVQAESIHSKKSQGMRTDVLESFKAGRLKVLVATDLISRGIDIASLPCVVNYELPRSPKDYIHRIGRTGRADASGEAISLVSPEELAHFRVIQKKMKRWVTMVDSEKFDLQGF